MFNLRSIKFTTKLFIGILTILVLSIFTVNTVTTIQVRSDLFKLGREDLKSISDSVFNSLVAQHSILQEKLSGDMLILENELSDLGAISLDTMNMRSQTITNQVTKAQEQATFPTLNANGVILNGNDQIVDSLQRMVGGVATFSKWWTASCCASPPMSWTRSENEPWARTSPPTARSTKPSCVATHTRDAPLS